MELKKSRENINRTFDSDGASAESIESVQYNVIDSEGKTIGNATVWQSTLSVNFNISGFSSIAEGEARLREALGATE